MAAPSSAPAADAVKRLLGSYVRVSVTDGRVLLGRLTCLDALGNTVLADCEEAAPVEQLAAESRTEAARRWIGAVSIKPQFIVRVECDSAALAGGRA
jgi:small nuclear ribonucleoprotein (snRNP)-like protein